MDIYNPSVYIHIILFVETTQKNLNFNICIFIL
jgi:hypothetical protein